ncbi:MAG: type II toxin-antitoxin system Phd/YefM family antitoxin [Bacteroidota bacterium]
MLAYYLKEIQEKGNPLVITQNGKPAGVLLSPVQFVRQTSMDPDLSGD